MHVPEEVPETKQWKEVQHPEILVIQNTFRHYSVSISKTEEQKSIFWPLFQNKDVSKLQNAVLTKISTLSHRYGLLLLDFEPNLWIFRHDLCQKCAFSEISGQKILIWGKFLIKILEIIPLFLFSGKARQANDCKVLKYNLKAFQKQVSLFC